VDIVPIFADMVYLLSKGKMKMEGSPEEVFNEMNDLRLPYIGLLLRALKKEGLELDVKLTVEEAKEEILKLWK
jgi:cobalt/nickel transport system ATP-binding protein